MCPTLVHIYGPFAINSYGLFIVIGILCALIVARKDPRLSHIITEEQALTLVMGSIMMGVMGARILYFLIEPVVITSWYDLLAFWEGGASELGSIIAILLFLGVYLPNKRIKLLPLLDLAGTYAPLVQAIARIGCFCAGCCYGITTTMPWAITYTNYDSIAPLWTPLHPVQLYMSALFFVLFFVLWNSVRLLRVPGQQFYLYIMGASSIRFTTEFLRGDCAPLFPSEYQLISLALFMAAIIALAASHYYHKKAPA